MIDILQLGFTAIAAALLLAVLWRLRQDRDIPTYSEALEAAHSRTEKLVREEMSLNRQEAGGTAKETREELRTSVKDLSDSLLSRLSESSSQQEDRFTAFTRSLGELTEAIETRLDTVRDKVDQKLQEIQKDNSDKLEVMRATVDEKLNESLEKRLGESFKLVVERLEKVHEGLGQMQSLATGVGDLKRVLTNVRSRGSLGEVQLEFILEGILTPDQYAKNVAVQDGSAERVEFAVKLPGNNGDQELLLPIDAKFPIEDYERLMQGYDSGDLEAIETARKMLEGRVKVEAKKISSKYINPPKTTSHAIMFVPTEGLFAELLRIPGLCDAIQREHSVYIAGPTTIAVIILGFQMGFKTLAIQKHSMEVWALLGAVKTEFGKFGTLLEKTQRKIEEAGNTLGDAARKSRTIERKLRNVEQLPLADAVEIIGVIEDSSGEEVES